LANRNASDRRGSVVVDGSIPLVFFSPRACPGPVKTKLHTKHDDPHSRRRAHRIERHTQCAVEIQDTRRGQGGLLALVACHSLRRMKVKGTGLPDWQRSKRSCRARSKRRELESRGCDDKRESAVISEAVRPLKRDHFRLKERNKVPAIEIWVVMNLLESLQRNAGLVAPHIGRPPDLDSRQSTEKSEMIGKQHKIPAIPARRCPTWCPSG
jgi:hypothetical protein